MSKYVRQFIYCLFLTLIVSNGLIAYAQTPRTRITLQDIQVVGAQMRNWNESGRHHDVIALAEKWLVVHGQATEMVSEQGALLLLVVANSYSVQAQFQLALQLQQRALTINEKINGPEHPDSALTLNNLAETYRALAQYDKALPLQQRAVAIFEKDLGPEHPDTAIGLGNLALIYISLTQYEKALQLQQRALVIQEKVLGRDHPDTSLALTNLAETYRALAQYDKALPLQQRALAVNEKVLGPDHPDTARSLNNLAETYRAFAQYEKAVPLQQSALAVNEKVLGPDHPDTARSLNNLAETYRAFAQYDKALPLQQRALAIREKVLGPDHPDTARSLNNLAETYNDFAQYDKALPLQQRALAIREEVLGPDHLDTALTLSSLAFTYSALGQHDKTLSLYQRVLITFENALGPVHPDTALAWSNLAVTAKTAVSPTLGISFLKRAVNTYQSLRERVVVVGSTELKSYTVSIEANYQALARWLTDEGRLPEAQHVLDMLKEEEQFDFIRRSAPADPRRTRMGYTPTEQQWMDRYQTIANQLAALGAEERELAKATNLGLNAQQQARQKALRTDLAVARKAFDVYMTEIQAAFATKGAARSAEVAETSAQATRELQALIRSLGDGVVLLQMYLTDDQVNLLLTTPGVQLARSAKVPVKELNSQIAALRRALREPSNQPLAQAQALYRLLLGPVEADLAQAGAKTVMLSLDGTLRYLPLGALHDGKQYAAQKWALPLYASVVKDKLRDAPTPQWQAAGLGVTRALGDFTALPAVRGEMGSIIQTRAGTGQTQGVMPGEVYLDEAFTALRLMDVGKRRFELLHVASHFRFSPGTEANSFLLLGDGQHLTLGDIRTQNYRFDQVELLTLSACDTGLGGGRDEKGREIEGFGVIAQQQGAKAVLATLWPVADKSTAMLMADMYLRRQSQGMSKIEALRQAQLALMAQPKYAHPFYWAPFILMGNWK
jgi:CHAT domain-containing protein